MKIDKIADIEPTDSHMGITILILVNGRREIRRPAITKILVFEGRVSLTET